MNENKQKMPPPGSGKDSRASADDHQRETWKSGAGTKDFHSSADDHLKETRKSGTGTKDSCASADDHQRETWKSGAGTKDFHSSADDHLKETRKSGTGTKGFCSSVDDHQKEMWKPGARISKYCRPREQTLKELLSEYEELMQSRVQENREGVFLRALQSQSDLVRMLSKENKKLQDENEGLGNTVKDLQKENDILRSATSSSRLMSNYNPKPSTTVVHQTESRQHRSSSSSNQGSSHFHLHPPTVPSTTQTEVQDCIRQNEELRKQVQDLKMEREKLGKKIADLNNSKRQLTKQFDDVELTLRDALRGVDEAQNEAARLKKENEHLKESKLHNPHAYPVYSGFTQPQYRNVSVQLVSKQAAVHGDVMTDLTSQVTSRLLQQSIKATFSQSDVLTDVRPLIIVCLRALRLGTDVNEALGDLNRDGSVGLVVLHHQGPHIRHCDVTEKQLSVEISNLGLVADVVFWKDRRVYESDINGTAITKLSTFLAQFAK